MITPLIREALKSLEAAFDYTKLSLVQKGCLSWLNSTAYRSEIDGRDIETAAATDYTALSYIGYAGWASSSGTWAKSMEQGCEWLAGRAIQRTTGELQSFSFDPVGLLGIVIGAQRIDSSVREKIQNHIVKALEASKHSFESDDLKKVFADACILLAGQQSIVTLNSSPATCYALLHRLGRNTSSELIDSAFYQCQQSAMRETDSFVVALHAYTLINLMSMATKFDTFKPTVEQILNILDGVQAGLMRWAYGQNKTQMWKVENEYDVQAMLYFLLRPYLPELKEEEPLSSIGRKRPRVDLVVPGLQLSIEVKFLRLSGKFNDILGEIAEDKSFYLGPGSLYSHMIVFLWDDSSRTEEHASFKQGVRELGLDGAVVVNRPSFMHVK